MDAHELGGTLKSCSCKGENENCYRCGGFGEFTEPSEQAGQAAAGGAAATPRRRPEATKVHVAVELPSSAQKTKPVRPTLALRSKGTQVRASGEEGSMSAGPPQSRRTRMGNAPRERKKAAVNDLVCGLCDLSIGKSAFQEHVRHCRATAHGGHSLGANVTPRTKPRQRMIVRRRRGHEDTILASDSAVGSFDAAATPSRRPARVKVVHPAEQDVDITHGVGPLLRDMKGEFGSPCAREASGDED